MWELRKVYMLLKIWWVISLLLLLLVVIILIIFFCWIAVHQLLIFCSWELLHESISKYVGSLTFCFVKFWAYFESLHFAIIISNIAIALACAWLNISHKIDDGMNQSYGVWVMKQWPRKYILSFIFHGEEVLHPLEVKR